MCVQRPLLSVLHPEAAGKTVTAGRPVSPGRPSSPETATDFGWGGDFIAAHGEFRKLTVVSAGTVIF